MTDNSHWSNVHVPEQAALLKKETYEYTVRERSFVIELFEQSDGMFYAIGVPKHEERLIIYGSNIVESRPKALQLVIDKIEREAGTLDYFSEC
ncbi:hypothetical protein LSG31_21705 [Fodinisporobacter ferrooxydans]|uniref:Uncharacterized protein n=1 Tax=Fodinisporobacter ferrooxydans TaxID=2901836 RepID=A0ABY4CIV2_9BACL|nr:hypothetical protein LSG31_21705 [Alicyclobacillaceae bacterium MYW30-H2]